MRHAIAHVVRIGSMAAEHWLRRNAFVHAGALAFYTLFSLAPVVIIAVSIAGAVFGEDAAAGLMADRLRDTIGPEAARAVQDAVARSRRDEAGLLPTIMGLAALALGATTVFAQMQTSLNRMWGVTARPQMSGLAVFVKNRVVSLAVVLGLGVVLLCTLIISVAMQALLAYAQEWVPVSGLVVKLVEAAISVTVIGVLFALIFKILPDAVVEWDDAWVGAATTSVLFVAGQSVIASYLALSAPASAYGAAGSLVLLLLWVYYSSLIIYFGASVTRTCAIDAGRRIVPRPSAVLVREELVTEPV